MISAPVNDNIWPWFELGFINTRCVIPNNQCTKVVSHIVKQLQSHKGVSISMQ